MEWSSNEPIMTQRDDFGNMFGVEDLAQVGRHALGVVERCRCRLRRAGIAEAVGRQHAVAGGEQVGGDEVGPHVRVVGPAVQEQHGR